MMTQNPAVPKETSRHDDRPLGVSIGRDQLRIGDRVNLTVEAQMMGLPTSVFLTYKNVLYRGSSDRGLQFDDELEPRYFRDHEIVRVALAED